MDSVLTPPRRAFIRRIGNQIHIKYESPDDSGCYPYPAEVLTVEEWKVETKDITEHKSKDISITIVVK